MERALYFGVDILIFAANQETTLNNSLIKRGKNIYYINYLYLPSTKITSCSFVDTQLLSDSFQFKTSLFRPRSLTEPGKRLTISLPSQILVALKR